jgi:hypothetical protein
MFRLCRACEQFRVAGSAVFALLLAGCATAVEQASQPLTTSTVAMTGTGSPPQGASRPAPTRRISSAEQDMIVARAIAAHEMRNP